MKKDLYDGCSIFSKIPFPIVYLPETRSEKSISNFFYFVNTRNPFIQNILRVYPCYQYIFIVTANKNYNFSTARKGDVMAPQVIMRQFGIGRSFKWNYPNPA